MIVSPTEPRVLLKHPATKAVSMMPENFGADILIPMVEGKWLGVQRKEFTDLIASVADNRLAEQTVKMRQLPARMLVIEGIPLFSDDGALLRVKHTGGMTRQRLEGVLWRLQADGVWIHWTRNLAETTEMLTHLNVWVAKHRSELSTRGPVQSDWGKPSSREFQRHLLCGLPGVGVELADRILDEVGMPMGLTVSVDDLRRVKGLGPRRIAAIVEALGGGENQHE